MGHSLGMSKAPFHCMIAAYLLLACSVAVTNASLEAVLGPELVTADGKSVSTADLKGKVIGLYFSAEWCPPCRTFTPVLEKFREANKTDFEVVLVSGDRSANALQAYMQKYSMDWPAIPFEAPQRNGAFDRFGVRGIPALVVVDANGKLLERDGRGQIANNPPDFRPRWLPGAKAQPVTPHNKPGEAEPQADRSALDQIETQTKEALGRGFDFLRKAQEASAPLLEKLTTSEPPAGATNN